MRVKLPGVLMAVFVLGAAVPAFAHHAFSVEFDAATVQGSEGYPRGSPMGEPARVY